MADTRDDVRTPAQIVIDTFSEGRITPAEFYTFRPQPPLHTSVVVVGITGVYFWSIKHWDDAHASEHDYLALAEQTRAEARVIRESLDHKVQYGWIMTKDSHRQGRLPDGLPMGSPDEVVVAMITNPRVMDLDTVESLARCAAEVFA